MKNKQLNLEPQEYQCPVCGSVVEYHDDTCYQCGFELINS